MVTLVPMSDAEYAAYVEGAVANYAAEKVASGEWTAGQSMQLATESFTSLLPQGMATPAHHLFTIRDEAGSGVGMLWVAARDRGASRIAYVYDVSIRPEHRRKGHAEAAFTALEERVRALGLSGIALHVFGHNTAAHALYVKLGFQPTNIHMFKPLG